MSQDRIELHVAGEPHGRPRPRARAVRVRGRWIAKVYQPKGTGRSGTKEDKSWAKANAWSQAIRVAAFQKMPRKPWTGPISLTIDAYFERPQRLLRKSDPDGPIRHTDTPDRDNLDKAVMDNLKELGLYVDDGQVCDGQVRKWYAAKGCGPGVIIVAERISELAPEDLLQPAPPAPAARAEFGWSAAQQLAADAAGEIQG